MGHNSASAGDNRGALKWRKISYGLSIAGIALGVIVVIDVVVLFVIVAILNT